MGVAGETTGAAGTQAVSNAVIRKMRAVMYLKVAIRGKFTKQSLRRHLFIQGLASVLAIAGDMAAS